MPMLRAVPSIMDVAASIDAAFRSDILDSAISRAFARGSFATFVLFGSPDAFSMPAAFFSKTAAGGVFVIKVKERSSKTVISTGMMSPACFAVR